MLKGIGDDEKRRPARQKAAALWVGAARDLLRRCRSATMHASIALSRTSCRRYRGAPNATFRLLPQAAMDNFL